MKVSIDNSTPERELVALIGFDSSCLFVRKYDEEEVAVCIFSGTSFECSRNLEELAEEEQNGELRQKVYKGDKVTIEF